MDWVHLQVTYVCNTLFQRHELLYSTSTASTRLQNPSVNWTSFEHKGIATLYINGLPYLELKTKNNTSQTRTTGQYRESTYTRTHRIALNGVCSPLSYVPTCVCVYVCANGAFLCSAARHLQCTSTLQIAVCKRLHGRRAETDGLSHFQLK